MNYCGKIPIIPRSITEPLDSHLQKKWHIIYSQPYNKDTFQKALSFSNISLNKTIHKMEYPVEKWIGSVELYKYKKV